MTIVFSGTDAPKVDNPPLAGLKVLDLSR